MPRSSCYMVFMISSCYCYACAYRETRTHADTGGRAQAVQPFHAQKSNERLTGMRQAVVKTRERQTNLTEGQARNKSPINEQSPGKPRSRIH